MKEIICNGCGSGCHVLINEQTLACKGNGCYYGMSYAKKVLAQQQEKEKEE